MQKKNTKTKRYFSGRYTKYGKIGIKSLCQFWC